MASVDGTGSEAVADLCRALELAASPAQVEALVSFLALLRRWNAIYNLTALREPQQILTQHLADCLAVVAPLRQHLGDGLHRRLLDVGSGGGLPGVVLAVMLPDLDVTCVDAVGKKAAFVRQASLELGLRNLHAEHSRVEVLQSAAFDVVTSRAFASLANFVALTRRHLAPGGAWLAMKGKLPSEEIAELPGDVAVFHVEPLRVPGLDAERCLIWIRPSPVNKEA